MIPAGYLGRLGGRNRVLAAQSFLANTQAVGPAVTITPGTTAIRGSNYEYAPIRYVLGGTNGLPAYDNSKSMPENLSLLYSNNRAAFNALARPTTQAMFDAIASLFDRSTTSSRHFAMGLRNPSGRILEPLASVTSSNGIYSLSSYGNKVDLEAFWNDGEPNDYQGLDEQLVVLWNGDGAKPPRFADYPTQQQFSYPPNAQFVFATGGYWRATDTQETFTTQDRPWTSTTKTLSDSRLTLNYQWVSNASDIFDARLKFRQVETRTPVVSSQQVTLYKEAPVFQSVSMDRSVVLPSQTPTTFAAFGNPILQAGSLTINSGHNLQLIAKANVTGDATITATRDLSISGKTISGAVQQAISELNAGGNVTLRSGRDLSLNAATDLAIGGNLSLTSGRDQQLDGEIGAASVTAAAGVPLISGGDTSGRISTAAASSMIATGAISLTAGVGGGDISLSDSQLQAGATLTLTAAAGGVYAANNGTTNDISAHRLVISAAASVDGSADGSGNFRFKANALKITSGGSIDLTSRSNVDIESLRSNGGGISLEAAGNVIAREVIARDANGAAAAITVSAPLPSGLVNGTSTTAAPYVNGSNNTRVGIRSISLGTIDGSAVQISAGSRLDQLSDTISTDSVITPLNGGSHQPRPGGRQRRPTHPPEHGHPGCPGAGRERS